MEYLVHLLILICIYLILAPGLNLNFGLGQQFNLAHVAAYSIGAYTTALLSTNESIQAGFFLCIISSVVISALFSVPIGVIAVRLKKDYFAIGTLSFSFVVSALLINWKSLTRGVLGIPGIPRPKLFSYEFIDNYDFLFLIAAFAIATQVVFYFIFNSPYARSLKAQAEFEEAALSLGKNAGGIRNVSFAIASGFAGLAGSFFAYYINYIDPTSFSLVEMIFVLTIIVVGKPGSFWGCIGAVVFLILLPEPLRFLSIPASILGHMRQLLYACILYAVLFFNKKNLFPVERKI